MFSRQEKIILATLACLQFSHIVDFMIMMPLGPQLMRIFNIDPHQFGLLVSSYTFTAGLSGFLASLFIDKFDRKNSLLFFYCGFAIGTIGCGLASSYELLLVARAVTGMFGGILGSLVMSIVSDTINFERRGTAMGVVMGAFSVASVFGVPFSLFLANHFDWHAPFLFLGFLSAAIWFLVMSKLPKITSHLKGPHQEHNPFSALIHIFKTPNQLWALLFLFCLVIGQFTVIPYLSQSFVANGGMKESELPLIYLVGGIFSFFASPFVGRMSDKFGKKEIFYASAVVSCLPIFVITNLGPQPTWLILAISSFFFICMSGRMVPAMAMISSTATPKFRGSFMSVSNSVQQLSAALASYAAGLIVTKNDAGNFLNYDKVGFIAIVFSLIAVFILQKVKAVDTHKASLDTETI